MKYILSLIVLFATPAYAHVSGNHGTGSHYSNGIMLVSQKQKQRVILYSTNGCPYCRQARNYFRAHRIPYVERNVDRSLAAQRQFEAMNTYGTPTIVQGNRRLVGFSVARFRNFYR